MPRRNDIAKILIIGSALTFFCGAFCLALATPQQSKPVRRIKVVGVCAPGAVYSLERIFANPGLKAWKEFSRAEDVPPLSRDTNEQMFAVSLTPSGHKYVRLMEYNEDASIFQTYCYDEAGILRSLKYEIRTEWGWGYSEDRIFGGAGQVTKRFFDTASNQTIKRPRQADDVPSFLQAKVYRSFDALPFIELMKKPSANAP